MNKIFLVLFIVLIATISIFLYIKLGNNQQINPKSLTQATNGSVTPSVNTFTSSLYGFSFTYPSGVKVPTKRAYPDEIVGLILANSPDNSAPIIDIRSIDNPDNLSIQAFNEQYKNSPNPSLVWGSLSNAQITSVGDKRAYFLQKSNCDPFFCDRYLIPQHNKIVDIYRLTDDPNHSSNYNSASTLIFNSIISTFRFTQ